MTTGIQSVSKTSQPAPTQASDAGAPRESVHRITAEQPSRSARPNAGGASAPPVNAGTISRLALMADPVSVVQVAQTQLRDSSSDVREKRIEGAKVRADHQQLLREIALKAARKSSKLLPGVLGDIIKAVVVAASTAASVVTGGSSLALAVIVVGGVLAMHGQHVADGLAKAGLISDKAAMGLGMGLQIAGSIMMMGGGFASAGSTAANGATQTTRTVKTGAEAGKELAQGAAEATQKAAEVSRNVERVAESATEGAQNTAEIGRQVGGAVDEVAKATKEAEEIREQIETVAKTIQVVAQLAAAGDQVDTTVAGMKRAKAERSASRHGTRRDQALEIMEDSTAEFSEIYRRHARVTARLQAAREARNEAHEAAIRAMA